MEYEYQRNIHKASKIESSSNNDNDGGADNKKKTTFKSSFDKVDLKKFETLPVFQGINEALQGGVP